MSWNLDKAHSNIDFTVRHMMISKVRGQFTQFEGNFELNETNPQQSKLEVKINANSIHTRDEKRDGHLQSADFLDAAKYPYLTFRSTSIQSTSKTTAVLKGDLTIRDVTKPVTINVEFLGSSKSPWGTTAYGFNGHTVLHRKDWNLTWNVALETGGVLVGDDIDVDIELELVKVEETEKQPAD